MTLETGQTVDERYRIVRLLGQGGMGAVYRAWDTRLNRPVALKELIPQPGLDEVLLAQLREQFLQEAQVLAGLVHPNLVRVTDHFTWNGNAYLVMDFVEGENLADRIKWQGPQPEAEVLRWAVQLLDALQYCHAHGVIHRDVKPQNIIIALDGSAVLVDFGLVKLWNPDDPQTRTVMRGAGTPEYAPPEQYDLGMGHTDPRSDVYSLGATLYHSLTGKMPPTATKRMATPGSFVHPRQFNATVSPSTEAAILRSMEMTMDRRFQSAAEMARALSGAAPEAPRPAAPSPAIPPAPVPLGPAARPSRERSRSLLLWFGVAAAVLCIGGCVIAIAAGVLSSFVSPEPEPLSPTLAPTFAPPTAVPTVRLATPVPTVAPRPTSTPFAVAGDVLLQDDFGDPGSGWEIGEYAGGSVGYGDGFYFVTATRSGGAMWGVFDGDFADVVVDVDATQISAPANNNNAYGVKCRVQRGETGVGGDGYSLMISGDGFYTIQIVAGGNYSPLVPWTASSAINQGNATNHIQVVCSGSHLVLIVNGEVLAEADDSTYTSGTVSLMAATLEDQMTEIHFDDLLVTQP